MNASTLTVSALTRLMDFAPGGLAYLEPLYENGQVVDFGVQVANPVARQWLGIRDEPKSATRIKAQVPWLADAQRFDQLIRVCQTAIPAKWKQYDAQSQQWALVKVSALDGGLAISFETILLPQEPVDSSESSSDHQRRSSSNDSLSELPQLVIDNIPSGLLLVQAVRDQAGTIIDFRYRLTNEYNARLGKKTVAELSGQLVEEVFPGWQQSNLFEWMVEVTESGKSKKIVHQYTAYGWDGWFDGSFVKVDDGVLYTYTDVTALKQAQLELQQQALTLRAANLDLQRSNEYLQQFASVASHDLREPLRKVQMFASRLEETLADQLKNEERDLFQKLLRSTERMQKLVSDVLRLSSLSDQNLIIKPVDLNTIIDQIREDLELAITERGAELKVASLPTVIAEPGQMHQLLLNLISNALKFNDSSRPTICVEAEPLTDEVATYMKLPHRGYAVIQVRDNGIGFDSKYKDKIFGMFQRLHGRSQYEGTGIGLTIVKKIIENHQGYIKAEGEAGQGATFRFALPLLTTDPEATDPIDDYIH